MHSALRKGPLFYKNTPSIFHFFLQKTPPFHFLPTGPHLSLRLSVPSFRQPLQHAAGWLLSAPRAGHADRQCRAPVNTCATTRRSAANAGSVMLTADLTKLKTDLLLFAQFSENNKLKACVVYLQIVLYIHICLSRYDPTKLFISYNIR